MKKLIFMVVLLLGSMATIQSCTEESVKPSNELDGGGGGGIDPKK
jgi:hypothetical protein